MAVETIDVLERMLTVAIALQEKELVLGRVFDSDVDFLWPQIDELLQLVLAIAEVQEEFRDSDWYIQYVHQCAGHEGHLAEIIRWLSTVSDHPSLRTLSE